MSLHYLWKHEPGNSVFSVMLYTISRKRHCFGLLYLRRSSSQYLRPHSPPARRRTAQCSSVLRQQRTPSATRRTLADNAAGVQQRCRATSHCSARRRDGLASWLATLQWTPSRPRGRDEVDSMFRELLKQQSHCRFPNTVYSMTEKTQFPGFMCLK